MINKNPNFKRIERIKDSYEFKTQQMDKNNLTESEKNNKPIREIKKDSFWNRYDKECEFSEAFDLNVSTNQILDSLENEIKENE